MFFVSDERMLAHRCLWDPTHIEKPERLSRILARLQSTGLLDDVIRLESAMASEEDVKLVHTDEYIRQLEKTPNMTEEEMETFCGNFEDIYVSKNSFELAFLSAGSALAATKAVFDKGAGATAFAAIRPPGHHASSVGGCGFCIFNNVAICAKKVRDEIGKEVQALKWGAERVLIVDWDVHAGQGTQYAIRDCGDSVRLVSLHRYQSGTFWPNLPESKVNVADKNTINVPLNATGMGDAEYLTAMHLLVLPLIYDYRPNLILISCGFDAALGDPEGEMRITPAGYGQLTKLLVDTGIPGGYFLDSIELDAEYVIRALQRKPLPIVPITKIKPEFVQVLAMVWERLASQGLPTFGQLSVLRQTLGGTLLKEEKYEGVRVDPRPYQTRGLYTYPKRTTEVVEAFRKELHDLLNSYEKQAKRGKLKVELVEEKTLSYQIEGADVTFKLPPSFLKFAYYTIILPLGARFDFDTQNSFGSSDTKAFAELLLQLKTTELLAPLPIFSFTDEQ